MNGTKVELQKIDFAHLDKVFKTPSQNHIPRELKNAISRKVYKSEIARIYDMSTRKLCECIRHFKEEHPELEQHIKRTYLNPPALWVFVHSELWYTDSILDHFRSLSVA